MARWPGYAIEVEQPKTPSIPQFIQMEKTKPTRTLQ
jgi:hypothetical protein